MPTSQHSTATVAAFVGRTDDVEIHPERGRRTFDHNPCAELRTVLENLLDAIDARFTPEGLERYPADAGLTRDFVTRVILARYLLDETN